MIGQKAKDIFPFSEEWRSKHKRSTLLEMKSDMEESIGPCADLSNPHGCFDWDNFIVSRGGRWCVLVAAEIDCIFVTIMATNLNDFLLLKMRFR